ncbi:MAG: DUF4386 domain-containing protein [Marinilabiliales bacterium]|nr:MAG: DUF4386 domain-containing protein [Marinilabiliales bacterium]
MEKDLSILKKTARIAGILYLIWIITGIFGLIYVPSQTIVAGNAVDTATKILNNEFIFRAGILNDLFSVTICIFLLLALYKLFEHVSKNHALLMVALFFVTIPVTFIMNGFSIASLMILKGELLQTLELSQRQDLAMLFLKINEYGILTLEMFWGLWLLPFAYLTYISGFIPRIIGIFLLLNGIAYIIVSFVSVLLPDYQTIITQIAMPFWILGEISITVWLLIKGVKTKTSTIA